MALSLLLAVGPGALLGLAVPAGRARWAVWAAAPILTLGLISASIAWLPMLGLPNGVRVVLAAEFALALGLLAVMRLAARRGDRSASPDSVAGAAALEAPPTELATVGAPNRPVIHRLTPTTAPGGLPCSASGTDAPSQRNQSRWLSRRRLCDLIGIVVPAVICVAFGRALVGRFRYPPGWDGMNHSIITRNIIETSSTAVTSACTTGSTQAHVSCHFYPLAADVAWAQAVTLSGGHISLAMAAWAELVGPLGLVVALYAVVRALGAASVIAACAATVPAVIGPIWESMVSGRVTEEVTPGFCVAVALLLALAARGRHQITLGALAGLGMAGVLMTHTYDALFAATLAIALVIFLRGSFSARRALSALAAAIVATMAVIAPFGTAIFGAKDERVSAPPIRLGVADALRYWITDTNRYALFGYPQPGSATIRPDAGTVHVALWLTIICLLASPLCFAIGQLRWARPWLLVGAFWTAIGIWTSHSTAGPAQQLAALWYNVPQRLQVMFFPVYGVLVVAGACAILLSANAAMATMVRHAAGGRRIRGAVATVAALTITLPLLGLGATPSGRGFLRDALSQRTAHGPQYTRVFVWLKRHTARGDVVAYARNLEFMTWSYANYGVPMLFGIPPVGSDRRSLSDYAHRLASWDWLVNNPAGASTSGCLVRKYGIEFVVVGRVRIPGFAADYYRILLAQSRNLDVVHRDHGITVYRVNARGRQCAAAD